MDTPKHAFREYDIRGKADVELSDELVTALGRAVATHLRDETHPSSQPLSFAVARDCRLSSDRLFDGLCAGLTSSGANVIDLGVGPTPLLYFGAHHLKTDGAVMITGSHNPAEDNGFKMMSGTATLFGPDIAALRQIIEQDRFADGPQGSVSAQDLTTAYCQALSRAIDLEGLSTDLSVVVDGGNGSAGPLGLRALGELGFRPDGLFCDMDGTFPNHHPDPTVEDNLVALQKRVASTGAQLGIAWDGDGDRIGVIDDQGGIVWGDQLMVLFSRGVLASHPGATILGEVKCSQTLFADIAARGGNPLVCRTGHSLIKKRMKEEKALLAGEMSGHIFFADRYFGFDDAIYAAARLLELVAREGKGPRELLADLPATAATPEIRRPCPDATKFAVVQRVLDHFRATHDVLDVDGARINFGDDAWGLCRASNTGPILVLRFEARSEARLGEIRNEVEAVVAAATRELGDA